MKTAPVITPPFAFHIWERLQLLVGDEGKEGFYSCRIADITRDRLVIDRPLFERGRSLLADNRMIVVHCMRADAAYAFTARIKEAQPKSADRMYLQELGEVRRLQRRRFVRLDKVVQVKYRVLPDPLAKTIGLCISEMDGTRSLNMSAGGMLIEVQTELAADNRLLLAFERRVLDNLPPYIVAITRHVRVLEGGPRVAGIEFILREDLPRHFTGRELELIPEAALAFDDRMQNRLVSELFAEQLVMRQKGLL